MTEPALRLVRADAAALDAALAGPAEVQRVLGRTVADGWCGFPRALEATRDAAVADPAGVVWGARLYVLEDPATLVGWGGFKSAPRDGTVEIGYEIAPGLRDRGLATAGVRMLLDEAWACADVTSVIALTLPEPGPSVRVLEKTGFTRDGEALDEDVGATWRHRLQRPS